MMKKCNFRSALHQYFLLFKVDKRFFKCCGFSDRKTRIRYKNIVGQKDLVDQVDAIFVKSVKCHDRKKLVFRGLGISKTRMRYKNILGQKDVVDHVDAIFVKSVKCHDRKNWCSVVQESPLMKLRIKFTIPFCTSCLLITNVRFDFVCWN